MKHRGWILPTSTPRLSCYLDDALTLLPFTEGIRDQFKPALLYTILFILHFWGAGMSIREELWWWFHFYFDFYAVVNSNIKLRRECYQKYRQEVHRACPCDRKTAIILPEATASSWSFRRRWKRPIMLQVAWMTDHCSKVGETMFLEVRIPEVFWNSRHHHSIISTAETVQSSLTFISWLPFCWNCRHF